MSVLLNTSAFKYRTTAQGQWQALALHLGQEPFDEIIEAMGTVVLQSPVQTISENGTTASISLSGLTSDHVVGNWGMFSDANCTTPIPENSPTCDITITTGTDSWSITIANFTSTFYIKPTFILKQN